MNKRDWTLAEKLIIGLGAVFFFIKEVPAIAQGFSWLWNHSEWSRESQSDATGLINSTGYADRWMQSEPYQPGNAGIYQTLHAMRALVKKSLHDPAVRNFAVSLVRPCPGHGFDCEIKRCFEYIRDHITYRRDPVTIERVQDARATLFEFYSGDCDDKVVALCALLGALGLKTRFVVIGQDDRAFTHVYCEVRIARGWLPLDPTNENAAPGWEAGSAIREAYPIFED